MQQLQCMVAVPRLGNNYFRLMDSLGPFWKELATGLGCPKLFDPCGSSENVS